LNLRPDEFCIGFVGRLTTQKAPERLVEAMAKLKDRQIDATAIVVGSGPEEGRVRELIARHGLETHVRLLGDVVATNVMPAFDLFCLPSRYEGLPYVLLEALAAGLPIVARRVGGVGVCVEHGGNGWIVDGDGGRELADALADLAQHPERRGRFAERSLSKSAEMSRERMLEETVAVYEKVTGMGVGR
jgi:glycosyltransferase involved in cell wall biosynthesis